VPSADEIRHHARLHPAANTMTGPLASQHHQRSSSSSASVLLLGIDTGGTYTDAVVYDEQAHAVVATAKAPTTHHDLSIGIRAAIEGALSAAGIQPARIELVSLSTTLATNALVEGSGRPVCAVIIGFDDAVVERGGLADALGPDPAIFLRGGHDSHGAPIDALDLATLEARIGEVASNVDAFAVTAQFSVRNPEHEVAASELIRRVTHKPVSCSHHLSARLNGPKRAVTAVLNARLIAIIDELVATTERTLAELGLSAPLMVVRGDGSLVSAAFVRERPIETILSGPAASLVGGAHLTGTTDAIVADIGGTTTDIAVLRDSVPIISEDGATVGGHRTMVSAVAMSTHGLGGDSHVRHDARAAGASLQIGPRRVTPLSLLAMDEPSFVHHTLERQLRASTAGELDGMLVILDGRPGATSDLTSTEADVINAIRGRVAAVDTLATSMTTRRVIERLIRRRVLALSAFTPTDASHVTGMQQTFDARAAGLGAELLARQRDRLGRAIAADAVAIAELTIGTLVRRSAEAVLAVAFSQDGLPDDAIASAVVQSAIERRVKTTPSDDPSMVSMVSMQLGLSVPLIALGASAGAYYPHVARIADAQLVVPRHADVANAVGAVVGRVRITSRCTISAPQHGQFIVHAGAQPQRFVRLDEAIRHATDQLDAQLKAEMAAAGAVEFQTNTSWAEQTVEVGGSPLFVEGTLSITGSGRPVRDR
jgi:N-methylhydantoinase A/oxoprolinase/acetone carboxylase beta subunit